MNGGSYFQVLLCQNLYQSTIVYKNDTTGFFTVTKYFTDSHGSFGKTLEAFEPHGPICQAVGCPKCMKLKTNFSKHNLLMATDIWPRCLCVAVVLPFPELFGMSSFQFFFQWKRCASSPHFQYSIPRLSLNLLHWIWGSNMCEKTTCLKILQFRTKYFTAGTFTFSMDVETRTNIQYLGMVQEKTQSRPSHPLERNPNNSKGAKCISLISHSHHLFFASPLMPTVISYTNYDYHPWCI